MSKTFSKPATSIAIASSRATHKHFLSWLARMHFLIGLFVGPFLLVAALSGVVYALTPSLENAWYADTLYSPSRGTALPLAAQVESARIAVANAASGTVAAATHLPDPATSATTTRTEAGNDASLRLIAVRPSPRPGVNTWVMFNGPTLRPSESRAIFVDPVTGAVHGDLIVYGTAGVLPIRGWLDQFHRGLLLGNTGRLYSELAASWLWVIATGGLVMWLTSRRAARAGGIGASSRGLPERQDRQRSAARRWHRTIGVVAFIGLLFFSATGLTWSQWAGDNIGLLRARFHASTPALKTTLPVSAGNATAPSAPPMAAMPGMPDMPEMADMAAASPKTVTGRLPGNVGDLNRGPDDTRFDAALAAARAAGIDAKPVEIRPPSRPGRAWTVTEIQRRWPTKVDAVAVDPVDGRVIDHLRFKDYPLAGKLTRWGIDAHMGTLFGLANQLVLAFFGITAALLIVLGYAMWWRRLRTRAASASTVRRDGSARDSAWRDWLALPWTLRCLILVVTAVFAYSLPVMGVSLLLFVLIERLTAMLARRVA